MYEALSYYDIRIFRERWRPYEAISYDDMRVFGDGNGRRDSYPQDIIIHIYSKSHIHNIIYNVYTYNIYIYIYIYIRLMYIHVCLLVYKGLSIYEWG